MNLWNRIKRHFVKCLLGGLVATLPVGGLALILYWMDTKLRILAQGTGFDFVGVGLIAGLVCLYRLGLAVTTFLGRWLLDRLLGAAPGISAAADRASGRACIRCFPPARATRLRRCSG